MDGQVDYNNLPPMGEDAVDGDESDPEEVAGAEGGTAQESSFGADDGLEQPDGQRNSLSLDDDGGTHFEASNSQETVIRRGGPVHDNSAASSPTQQDVSNDNDVVFNPAQRLNFEDDDDDDDEDEHYDDEVPENSSLENDNSGDGEFLTHRPVVNGSDVAEGGAYGGASSNSASDQGQNIRIIEGHDSSLIDDGSLSFGGFNFLQTQMVQMPLISPVHSGLGHSRMDDPGHNLYDSLERVDGASLFGDNHENVLENNTSEYFSAGSVSLMAANSQGPDTDSVWAQDDNSDHGSYLSHSQPQFHSHAGNAENHPSRHQSPPRNFQVDNSNMYLARKRGSGSNYALEGNMGGFGDVSNSVEDNSDVLSLELSEEGLLHNTQMYAQPVPSAGHVATGDNMATSRGDNMLLYQPQHLPEEMGGLRAANSGQAGYDGASGKVGNHQTQPKNLARNQSQSNSEPLHGSHTEGDGLDSHSDERQAGAGSSSSASDQNQSAGDSSGHQPVAAMRKSASGKVHSRRPAVQGSASSGNSKRSSSMNPRPGVNNPSASAAQTRKAPPPSSARDTGTGDVAMRGNGGARKKTPNEGNKSSAGLSSSASGLGQARHTQGQAAGLSPLTSRASSHTSLASNASSTNSRVSGVGKESHHQQQHQQQQHHPQQQLNPRGASSQAAGGTDVHHHLAQKLQETDVHHHLPATHHHPPPPLPQAPGAGVAGLSGTNPHQSQSFERLRPNVAAAPPQHMLRGSQSLSKAHATTSAGHSQHQNTSGFTLEKNEPQLPQSGGQVRGAFQLHPASLSSQEASHPQQQQLMHPHRFMQQQQQQQQLFSGLPTGQERSQVVLPMHPGYSQGMSPSGSEGSHHSFNREMVVTQMDALRRQGHRLSPNEVSSQRAQLDNDLQGMEEVRSHLQNMLRIGTDVSVDASTFDQSGTATDLLLSDQPVNRQLHFETDSSSYLGNSQHEDMSDILENFPTFSSKMFSDMSAVSSRNDAVVHGEVQYLRESLEKERYRRKHCEEHIQKLNTKLLEIQQQLAVAVSTDKRKDIMIEQLDKQLAKVVEGWKKRECEKDEFMKVLSQEKEQIEETLQKQQKMVNNFEQDLAQTVEELRVEKEQSAETINSLKEELIESRQRKEEADAALESEREKFSKMSSEWEELRESRELAEGRAQQAQEKLVQEQDSWQTKEKELTAKILEVKEANQKVINMEKVKLEEQKKKREEVEAQSEELKTELKRAVLDMEQLVREKESQKVEMAIMEAKFESTQRKLETDLHAQMEKEIADQASEFHGRMESTMEEMSERHRKQVAEIHVRHQKDTERQMVALNEDREKKEEEYRRQITDLEEKLQDMRSENSSLKQSKLKLESQRMEILTKLQFMMQSQWNEAVSLLVSTPQKKNLNSSFMSSQSGGQLASAMAVTDGNTSVTSVNLVSSGMHPTAGHPARSLAQLEDTGGSRTLHSSTSSPPRAGGGGGGSREMGRGGDGKDRGEEDRMDRVEEYLHSLGDSRHTTNGSLPQPQGQQRSSPLRQGLQGSSYEGESEASQTSSDAQSKVLNKDIPSEQTQVHGYISGQNGGTLITAAGAGHEGHSGSGSGSSAELLLSQLTHQAVAMRSPQQSSSRHSDSIPPAAQDRSLRESHQSRPHPLTTGQHPYLLDSRYSQQNFPPPHPPHHQYPQHQQQQHPQQQQQNLQQRNYQQQQQQQHRPQHGSPRQQQPQSHLTAAFSTAVSGYHSNSNPLTQQQHHQAAGDLGDYKDVRLANGATSGNINIYSPESPTLTSSPAAMTTTGQWSPRSPGQQVKRFQAGGGHSGVTVMPSSLLLAPASRATNRNVALVPESPVKRHRGRSLSGPGSVGSADGMNESLSPPVKQTAERDHGDDYSDSSGGFHDSNRLLANYSQLSDRVQAHENRQGDLQHYVRMLLSKAPGSVCSEPERDVHSEQDILESSRDLTVDLDLNDTAQAFELTAQLNRLQHLRERQGMQRRAYPGLNMDDSEQPSASQSGEALSGHLSDFMSDNGVISTQGLSEISHLLAVYRDQWETNPDQAGQENVAGQLMDALKGMASSMSKTGETSKQDERKVPMSKSSPKSHPMRKPKEISKVRKVRNTSQSADTSVTGDSAGSDKSMGSSRPPGPAMASSRKVPQPQETTNTTGVTAASRERKVAGGRQPKSGGGGPVWK